MRDSSLALLEMSMRPVTQPRSERLRGQRLLQMSVAGGDFVVIAVATVLAVLGRSSIGLFQPPLDMTPAAESVGLWVVAGWMLVNLVSGTYAGVRLGVGTTEYARVLSASAATAGLIAIVSYLTNYRISRGFFVLLIVIAVPLLLLWRFTARRLVHRAHARGRLLTRVIVSGSASHVDDVAAVLERESWLGYQIVGALLPPTQSATTTPAGRRVVGFTTETAESLIDTKADLVVFTEGAFPSAADFRRITWDLEGRPVQMAVVPSLSDISSGRMTMRPVGGLPLVHVEQPQSMGASRGFKRTFDLVGASLILLVTAPIMIGLAVAIRLEDGGPVFFRQTRVGRDATLFQCFKLRSMVIDAEAQLAGVTHLNANRDGLLFKMQHDPRITRVGRLIRRTSLDELPQLFNVIRGEMSLVGPRPALPAEVRRYAPDVQRRLHVRPGMTGLWQVSGRSDLSWNDTVRLDLYYVDNWSVVQDLTIMMRTIQAVAKARGAY